MFVLQMAALALAFVAWTVALLRVCYEREKRLRAMIDLTDREVELLMELVGVDEEMARMKARRIQMSLTRAPEAR